MELLGLIVGWMLVVGTYICFALLCIAGLIFAVTVIINVIRLIFGLW